MILKKRHLFFVLALAAYPIATHAGLDLENQTEIRIEALDLNHDARITREETAEYLFYYFDHDGNEVLTKGEYHADRDITVIPYEGDLITFIDLDNDGQNDDVSYTQDTFLDKIMIGEHEPGAKTIKAYNMLDIYFSRLDTDKSKGIESDEWHKIYLKHAVNKPNMPPEAANNDHYSH